MDRKKRDHDYYQLFYEAEYRQQIEVDVSLSCQMCGEYIEPEGTFCQLSDEWFFCCEDCKQMFIELSEFKIENTMGIGK